MIGQCYRLPHRIDLAGARLLLDLPAASGDQPGPVLSGSVQAGPIASLVLRGPDLTNVLRLEAGQREVHIFAAGYLVFVDFEAEWLLQAWRQLAKILTGQAVSSSFGPEEILDLEQVPIADEAVRLAARLIMPAMLVQSVELRLLEIRMEQLLDLARWASGIVRKARQWPAQDASVPIRRRWPNRPDTGWSSFHDQPDQVWPLPGLARYRARHNIRQVVICQYATARQLRPADRPAAGLGLAAAMAAEVLADYLELSRRRRVFASKLSHFTETSQRQARRQADRLMLFLYWFEVVLLVLFPLLHILS